MSAPIKINRGERDCSYTILKALIFKIMSNINPHRLSSDYIYNYTPECETIKLILKNGLRYSLNEESVTSMNFIQQNFIICFCDILPKESDYHRSVYGKCGISFKKEWAIKNGISPVTYIHNNSSGTSNDYWQSKNDMRNAHRVLNDGGIRTEYIMSLILLRTAKEKNLFNELETDNLEFHCQEYLSYFNQLQTNLGIEKFDKIMNKLVEPVFKTLEQFYDELERRDAFLRIYQGDFRDVENKILYDEREWRSVKILEPNEKDILSEAIKNKFLPEEFNLKFNKNDISAILVHTDEEKQEIQNYIIQELHFLHGAEQLVSTFDEHLSAQH